MCFLSGTQQTTFLPCAHTYFGSLFCIRQSNKFNYYRILFRGGHFIFSEAGKGNRLYHNVTVNLCIIEGGWLTPASVNRNKKTKKSPASPSMGLPSPSPRSAARCRAQPLDPASPDAPPPDPNSCRPPPGPSPRLPVSRRKGALPPARATPRRGSKGGRKGG